VAEVKGDPAERGELHDQHGMVSRRGIPSEMMPYQAARDRPPRFSSNRRAGEPRCSHRPSPRQSRGRLDVTKPLRAADVGHFMARRARPDTVVAVYTKLDISLVRGVDGDKMRQALVAGLDYFALQTGCRLIAEGVETAAEVETLVRLGVELGQGYFLGRPDRFLD
jgi:hypothetical protein